MSEEVPEHAHRVITQLTVAMYARTLQGGMNIQIPMDIQSQVHELRTRGYKQLEQGMKVLQGFIISLSVGYLPFIIEKLLKLDEIFQDPPPSVRVSKATLIEKDEQITPFLRSDFKIENESEDNSMEYFILNTIHLVLKANLNSRLEFDNNALAEYFFQKLSAKATIRRAFEASRSLSILSQRNLGELCVYIINKLRNSKLSDRQHIFFQQIVREFDFGVETVPQRNSTMLYLSYQAQVMESTTKESLRREICYSLKFIFGQILRSEDPAKKQIWDNFCQADDASHFWKKFEDIYKALNKWTKNQKPKNRFVCFDLMAMMLGFGPQSIRDKFADSLLRSVTTQYKDIESYEIIRDYLCYLKYSEDEVTESVKNQLVIIAENMVPRSNENSPDSIDFVNILIDIGVELGTRDVKLVCEQLLLIFSSAEGGVYYKLAALYILTAIAQNFYTEFTRLNYHNSTYEGVLSCMDNADKEVNEYLKDRKQEKREVYCLLLSAAISCFPHVNCPPEKQIPLIERITNYSTSPIANIADAALYSLRDHLLIDPSKFFVQILTNLLNTLTNYFETDEEKIKRVFYNIITILQYINQGISMNFDMDVNADRLMLLRARIEGTILVWLTRSEVIIHDNCWRLLELLSNPLLRRLEDDSDTPPCPHIVDHLPRPTRYIGGDALIDILPKFLETQFQPYFMCLNWAWSNLYNFISSQASYSTDILPETLRQWANFYRFLCVIPRHAPPDANFEEKSKYLSSGIIGRFFHLIASILKKITLQPHEVSILTKLHPSCYNVFLQRITTDEGQEFVKKDHQQQQQDLIFKNPMMVSILSQLILNMDVDTFLSVTYQITPFYRDACQYWFTKSNFSHLSKLSNLSKRDILLTLNQTVKFFGTIDVILPEDQEITDYPSKVIYIMKFLKKLLPEQTHSTPPSDDVISLDCAYLTCITTVLGLKPVEGNYETIEKYLLSSCSRGIHVLEFSDTCISQYLVNNESRFSVFVHYCAQSSPSVTQEKTNSNEYCLTVTILRALIEVIEEEKTLALSHVIKLFLLSLYFQCSFDVVCRSLGVEIAFLISGRNDKLKREMKLQLSTTNLRRSGRLNSSDGFKVPDKLETIDPINFLPCSSHVDRDVYIGLAQRYSKEVALKYDVFTRDIIMEVVEFNKALQTSTDISLMLRLMKPWARNYGTIVKQPPRWVIRSIFELSLVYHDNDALVEAIQQLWEEVVKDESSVVVPMAIEWLLNYCAREIKNESNNLGMVVRVCCLACLSCLRGSREDQAQTAVDFLISKLRTFPDNIPMDTTQFLKWFQTKTVNMEEIDKDVEKAAFMFLVPLALGENRFSYGNSLPLILQHAFVLFWDPSATQTSYGGEQLVANLLQGLQMRPSTKGDKLLVSSQYGLDRLANIRESYFPDTCMIAMNSSPLNYSIPLNSSPDPSLATSNNNNNNNNNNVVNSTLIALSSRKTFSERKKTLRRDNGLQIVSIPYDHISRLVDLLSIAYPNLRSEWTKVAFNWAMYSPEPAIACNSFALFGSLADKLQYDQLSKFVLSILTNSKMGERLRFTFFSKELTSLLSKKWYLLDYKSFDILTSISIILLQMKPLPLFSFGLNILNSMYEGDKFENFEKVSQFSLQLWNSIEKQKPFDEVILFYLFKGLEKKNTCELTLWALETFIRGYNNKITNRSPIVIAFLLFHHVLSLADKSLALNSFNSIKLIDFEGELSAIANTFRKYDKKNDTEKFLEQFYNEFVAIYPEEDVFNLSLSILIDLLRSDRDFVQLACIQALGNFVKLNYIHDLNKQQCSVLANKVLICSNIISERTDECVKPLLLFLLTDTRANRSQNMFDMVMEVDRLRADKSGTYPTFLEEAEDYQIFFDLIQQYLSSTHTLPEFVDKNDKWNDFIKPKMEKQTTQQTLSFIQEEKKVSFDTMKAKIQIKEERKKQKLFPAYDSAKQQQQLQQKQRKSSKTLNSATLKKGTLKKIPKSLSTRKKTKSSKKIPKTINSLSQTTGAFNFHDDEDFDVLRKNQSENDIVKVHHDNLEEALSIPKVRPNIIEHPADDPKLSDLRSRLLKIKEKDVQNRERRDSLV